MNKANVNGVVLTDYLDFLIEKGLVEERIIKNRSTVFIVTERGINLLKIFREFTQVLTADIKSSILHNERCVVK